MSVAARFASVEEHDDGTQRPPVVGRRAADRERTDAARSAGMSRVAVAAPRVARSVAGRLAVSRTRSPSGSCLLSVHGVASRDSAADLIVDVEHAVRCEPRFALDLSHVEATNIGLVLLLSTVCRIHQRRGDVVIVCPAGPLRRELERMMLGRRLAVVEDAHDFDELDAVTQALPTTTPRRSEPKAQPRRRTLGLRAALLADATIVLERRYPDPMLALHDIASEIATSSRQLQRIFEELVGSSFRDELRGVRMRHAAVLLHETDLGVGAIAESDGYRQHAQFAKAFRRHVGASPTTFRRWR